MGPQEGLGCLRLFRSHKDLRTHDHTGTHMPVDDPSPEENLSSMWGLDSTDLSPGRALGHARGWVS